MSMSDSAGYSIAAGLAVALVVGDSVGAGVGNTVSDSIGAAAGLVVGDSVGILLGILLGIGAVALSATPSATLLVTMSETQRPE